MRDLNAQRVQRDTDRMAPLAQIEMMERLETQFHLGIPRHLFDALKREAKGLAVPAEHHTLLTLVPEPAPIFRGTQIFATGDEQVFNLAYTVIARSYRSVRCPDILKERNPDYRLRFLRPFAKRMNGQIENPPNTPKVCGLHWERHIITHGWDGNLVQNPRKTRDERSVGVSLLMSLAIHVNYFKKMDGKTRPFLWVGGCEVTPIEKRIAPEDPRKRQIMGVEYKKATGELSFSVYSLDAISAQHATPRLE